MGTMIEHVSTVGVWNKGALAVSDALMRQATNGSTIVYGVVRAAGENGYVTIQVWRLGNDGAMSHLETVEAAAGPVAGVTAQLTLVPSEQAGGPDDLLIITGVDGARLWSQSITSDGTLSDHSIVVSDPLAEDLNLVAMVTVSGTSFAYCARLGNDRPAIYEIEPNGDWTQVSAAAHWTPSDGIEPVSITAFGVVPEEQTGGRPILVAALEGENVLVTYRVGMSGYLSEYDTVAVAEGWGVANPSVLEVVMIVGKAYALMGASGSNSISVVHVSDDGVMTLTDHIMDDLGTRFAGISVVSTLVDGDLAYVAVAGFDQGISMLRLFPDGTLQHMASFADTLDSVTDDVSAIMLTLDGGTLNILTLSTSEEGLSTFTMDVGTQGDFLTLDSTVGQSDGVLVGGANNDVLYGGQGDDELHGNDGDDVLQDGAGVDIMFGGAGRDHFILGADGARDEIQDFDPFEDMLDLSHWPFLRSVSQLTIVERTNGAELRFGDEVLRIYSHNGETLTAADFAALDVIQSNRFLPAWVDALNFDPDPDPDPESPTITGTSGDDVINGTPEQDTIYGLDGSDRIEAGKSKDVIYGGGGADTIYGRDGFDTLYGGTGDDALFGNVGADAQFGGDGNDALNGGFGADQLEGQSGFDTLWGSSGGDVLFGGGDDDSLWGQAGPDEMHGDGGNDVLDGGINFDTLYGGDGNDMLAGMNGYDTLMGDAGDDQISGNAGNDQLWGGIGNDQLDGGIGFDTLFGDSGSDTLFGNAGSDSLAGGSGNDTVYGNSGNDILTGGSGDDVLFGGQGADTFVFRGGDDRIADFSVWIDRLTFDADLWVAGAPAPDDVLDYASIVDGNVVFDFGGGDRLTLSDVSSAELLLGLIDIA